MLSGWEGLIVLTDVRGLDPDRARAVSVQASLALIRASTGDASPGTGAGDETRVSSPG